MAKMFSMKDWEKTTIEEVKMRWGNRRRELDEIEREKKIEEARKRKDEKRRRAIKERRCFVCGIFGHMARYCKNREEKRGSSMPQNKFEILKDRVMQRGEGSGREVEKDRREILREEREKKERKMKTKVQKRDLEKKEKKIDDEKVEEMKEKEREIEMRGFSGGEILKGRYPLVWQKVRCYECGGLGHRKKDHREIKTMKKKKDKIEDKEKEDKKDKTMKKAKKDKKKIEKREIGIETQREKIVEKTDVEISTEEEIVEIEDKREIELREREDRVEIREKEI